jgi:phasin
MTATTKQKTKSTAGAYAPGFETRFEMPKFDFPKMEVPAAFREIAEKGVFQAKENYEKLKSAAEEATDVLEETYAKASKGNTEYGLKVLEAARKNTDAAFDFFSEFITVKSLSEAVELSTAHARKQFETLSAQAKELSSIAQKAANEAGEPIKNGVTKAFSKVA